MIYFGKICVQTFKFNVFMTKLELIQLAIRHLAALGYFVHSFHMPVTFHLQVLCISTWNLIWRHKNVIQVQMTASMVK